MIPIDVIPCSPTHAAAQSVELLGGSDGHEGTVRLYKSEDKRWGAVCDDLWSLEEAHVICRMMSFPRALVAWKYSHFGPIDDDILYDDVQCEGKEDDIGLCAKSLPWVHDCDRFEHAGVTCAKGKGFLAIAPPKIDPSRYLSDHEEN